MADNQIITETIHFCNAIRHRMGFSPVSKLEKGHRGFSPGCPISSTIMVDVEERFRVYTSSQGVSVYQRKLHGFVFVWELPLTQPADVFRSQFDSGFFSEYALLGATPNPPGFD